MKARNMHNVPYISEHVDIFEWWKQHNTKFPLVSAVAAVHLALPQANGFQERVFGMGSTVDTPLRKRLGRRKFEQLVLMRMNAQFIEEHRGFEASNMNESEVGDLVESYFLDIDEESQ